jgi:DNA (cytosine-5)-methyltransferase 1
MRLLDLFSGAGGAAMGYHRAGFTQIVGVDNRPMPRYPFTFVQADALEYVAGHGYEFDAIHASPPCQRYSRSSKHAADERGYPDLVAPTRRVLESVNRPFVIENVVGAPLQKSILCCGVSFRLEFGDWYLARHRIFESSVYLFAHSHRRHPRHKAPLCIAGHGTPSWGRERIRRITGRSTQPKKVCRVVMGIDWMTWQELTQAIPPAYTEFIGKQLIDAIRYKASAD